MLTLRAPIIKPEPKFEPKPDRAPEITKPAPPPFVDNDSLCFKARVEEYEMWLMTAALKETDGNRSEAAKRLKINRTTLVEKIKRYRMPNLPYSLNGLHDADPRRREHGVSKYKQTLDV